MSQFASKQSGTSAKVGTTEPARPGPGKSTLVEASTAGVAPVQHKQGSSDAADVHAQAEAGTAGAGGPLPFLDSIQQQFGKHDVRGVTAHTDGAAAGANAQMGSKAFARGNAVAFGGTPDLHTAAHEAAHVVQQRSGVSLKGGVGASGDAYERHADAVADNVVAGRSAEGLLSTMAGGGGGQAVVQHQAQPGGAAGGGAGANQAPQAPATAGPNLTRVQAAIAAQDVAALVALQTQLLPLQATDPDAHAGLVAARTWEMDRIAAIRDTYTARLASARTAAPDAESHNLAGTNAVEALETAMDAQCTPYLDALMHGDPQARYTYGTPDTVITGKVFEAVRLHAMRRGVAQIGHRADAEAEARQEGGVPTGSWCGAFAYTQGQQAGGMDNYWAANMAGTPGVMAALAYGNMATLYLWVDGAWVGLRDYHNTRGSLRHYEAIQRAAPAMGIQAGDLALVDNAKGVQPDHIATVISFDGRYVTLVGGNQGGAAATDETGVSRSDHGFDLQQNPTPFDARATDANGNRTDDANPALAGEKHAHTRIHGFGRWSIVDYERHVYRRSATPPTAPPTPTELNR